MGHLNHQREETGFLAWSFLPRDARWRQRDPWDDRFLMAAGKTFCTTDMLEMRRRHLDAWEHPLDALHHAAGLVVCRVRLTGTIEREGYPRYYITHSEESKAYWGTFGHLRVTYEGVGRKERLYASEFRVLWTADTTLLIHRFACDLAERGLRMEREAGREPDDRAWAMVAARRAWLEGTLTDDDLQAAWLAFDTAWREWFRRSPRQPHGRPMTESERHDFAGWQAHANVLRVIRDATEPVPLALGRSVKNVKWAAGFAPAWQGGETQEQRIAIHATITAAINAELEQMLLSYEIARSKTDR